MEPVLYKKQKSKYVMFVGLISLKVINDYESAFNGTTLLMLKSFKNALLASLYVAS